MHLKLVPFVLPLQRASCHVLSCLTVDVFGIQLTTSINSAVKFV